MLKVLDPINIQKYMIDMNTLDDSLYSNWSYNINYVLTEKVIDPYNSMIYECINNHLSRNTPSNDGSNWTFVSPANSMAMFDRSVNTYSEGGSSSGIYVKLTPRQRINGIALLDMVGISSATITLFYLTTAIPGGVITSTTDTYSYGITMMRNINQPGGYVQFIFNISLESRNVSNWREYFIEPYAIKTDCFIGFPSRSDYQIEFTTSSANCKIGAMMLGNFVELGDVGYGVSSSIDDYSIKTTNAYGVTTLTARDYTKRVNYPITVPNWAMRRSFSTLSALRTKPAVFIGSDDYRYTPFTVYGYVSNFDVSLSFSTFSIINIEVKGFN